VLANQNSKINFGVKFAILMFGLLLALFLIYWIFDKIFIYFVARSYVQEIADAFDLNKYLARAIVYATFVAIAFFGGMIVSFSKQKRLVGVFGIVGLLIAHSLIMFLATRGEVISTKGEALKCYVITRDTVRYGEHAGIDPGTGRQCRPVTPELVERLRAYEKGDRPKRIVTSDPVFFDLGTGEPIIWYYKNENGAIEIFDLMGFDPDTGDELLPVTKEVVDAWKLQKQQEARKAPQPIDPEKYAFFDPITGKPRVWYRRGENGDYEFYDRPGFHPLTGEQLTVITRDTINDWRKYTQETASQKCYVITRDSVQYGNHPGIDQATGRQCRPVTPELLRRLREYEKGNRPKKIQLADPTFFDLRTGEPIVWYYKKNNGDIDLFDLMGFDPDTGEELLPITKEIAELWKSHAQSHLQSDTRQAPQLIDPDKYAFFDPVTGKPRVWYWRGEKGEYEFYDNPGFHPRTGVKLIVISKEVIDVWKKDQQQAKVGNPADQNLCRVTDPTGTPLNIRTVPNGSIVATLNNGEIITVRDRTFDPNGKQWISVGRLGADVPLGWVLRDFVTCTTSSNPPSPPMKLGELSCDQLWLRRNSIFKEAGYCFKTPRSINALGNAGCRYNNEYEIRLTPQQKALVEEIQGVEQNKGCAR
jgi:hypothetical protein